jgi:hypothetical protein
MISLCQTNGSLIDSKTYDLKVHGGTPNDRDIPLDTLMTAKVLTTPSSARFPSRKTAQLPKLVLRTWKLSSSDIKSQLEYVISP